VPAQDRRRIRARAEKRGAGEATQYSSTVDRISSEKSSFASTAITPRNATTTTPFISRS
jgi:hypothetical protein